VALIRRSRPRRTARVDTSSNPALATRLGSSKVTSMRSIPRDTAFTESASWLADKWRLRHRYFPKQGGTFRGYAAIYSGRSSVYRGLGRRVLDLFTDCLNEKGTTHDGFRNMARPALGRRRRRRSKIRRFLAGNSTAPVTPHSSRMIGPAP